MSRVKTAMSRVKTAMSRVKTAMSGVRPAMSSVKPAMGAAKTAGRSRTRAFLLPATLLASVVSLTGCRSTPLFNVMGSFFPSWMVCLAAGILLTVLARWFFQRIDFERQLRPLVLIYPALVALFTCSLWLLMFS